MSRCCRFGRHPLNTFLGVNVSQRSMRKAFSTLPSSFSIKGGELAGRPIYLDFQATTPIDPRVLDAMLPFMLGRYGNPHSRTHSYGWETESAIEEARENIAKLIGATSKEIIFTSGKLKHLLLPRPFGHGSYSS